MWGLDKGKPMHRMGLTATMSGCEHKQTEFLMRRDGVDYIRCLGCDQVFEADDLEADPVLADTDDEQDLPQHRKAS